MTRITAGIAGIALGGLLALATGCSFDDVRPGAQGACADPAGILLGCPTEPILTPEDVCRKLVECGVLPFDREGSSSDYSGCVRNVERLPRHRREFVFACVEHSSCDDLERSETCFEHGEGP
jgi:hypothetical protein